MLRQDAVSRCEVWRRDKAVAGPLNSLLKHGHQNAIPKMEITTAMIHQATMDTDYQGFDLSPYKDYLKEIFKQLTLIT